MVRTIEILAAIGVLVLASCAKPPGRNTNNSDVAIVDAGVRSPHDMVAMLTEFTGGLTLGNSASIRGVYTTNMTSLPWAGGMSVNSIKAAKELAAAYCQAATQSAVSRPILFPGFDRNLPPRNASNALVHSATVRAAVVENLLVRATGEAVPMKQDKDIVNATFEDLLRLVPNTAAGTALAMDSICTVVASSALSGFGY